MDKISHLIAEIETLQSEIRQGKHHPDLASELLPSIEIAATTMRYTETRDGSNREYENFLRKIEYLLELGHSDADMESSTSTKKESDIYQYYFGYGSFSLNFKTFKACQETLNGVAETVLHRAVKECKCAEDAEIAYKETIDSLVIFIILNRAILNAKNCDGQTALMMAAENGCLHFVKVLADWEDEYDGEKVDLNAEDIYGETALFKAAIHSRVEVVEFLVQRGALDICDNRGFYALHAAVCGPCEHIERNIVSDFFGDFDWMTFMKHPFHLSTGRFLSESYVMCDLGLITENLENTAKVIDVLLEKYPESLTVEDFRGNTVLDWAVRSKTRISELTISRLKQCTHTKTEINPEELLNVDEWGRTSFHRLSAVLPSIFPKKSFLLDALIAVMHRASNLNEIHFEPFKTMACRKDKKGRTALHYAVMSSRTDYDVIETIIKLGCSVNETDVYSRTPLHYAREEAYELLLNENDADDTIKDCDEKTPEHLRQLRQKEECAYENAFERLYFKHDDTFDHFSHYECKSGDGPSSQVDAVTSSLDTSKLKKVDTWEIWTKRIYAYRDPFSKSLLQNVKSFFDRLAEEIKKMDPRFECRPVLVGSAYEGTRIGFMDELDFNLVLTKFGECCEIYPAPEAPVGFIRLQRKSNLTANMDSEGRSEKKLDFDRFFNNNGILMSNKVSSLFRCLYSQVMKQPRFWDSEPFFEWDSRSEFGTSFTDGELDEVRHNPQDLKASKNLCTNIVLRLNRPINGQYMFREIFVDIVPCIHIDGWWPDDTLSTVSNELRAEGCSLVFDQPQKKYPWTPVSADPYVRISFAEAESRIIKDSSVVAKAAYMVVKQMLWVQDEENKFTYVWKTSLLYCIEALNDERNKDMNYEDINREDLRSFVEKLMLCFFEFYLLEFCPCYMMPSFSLPIYIEKKSNDSWVRDCYKCKLAYKLYYSVCEGNPETSFRKPMFPPPLVERFDRDELMRKLSKIPNYPEYIVVYKRNNNINRCFPKYNPAIIM